MLLGLTPLVTFGTNVYASGIVDNRSDPIEFYKENSDYFDVQVEEDSTIVTITDNNLKAFLEMKGLDSSFLSKSSSHQEVMVSLRLCGMDKLERGMLIYILVKLG